MTVTCNRFKTVPKIYYASIKQKRCLCRENKTSHILPKQALQLETACQKVCYTWSTDNRNCVLGHTLATLMKSKICLLQKSMNKVHTVVILRALHIKSKFK